MRKFYILLLFGYVFANQNYLFAQSILNPNDSIVEYDSLNPPVQPPYGQIGKWVRTKTLSWNSDSYKCYIYEGSCFRLKFPKSYNPTANDGKKYPIALVFHGGGEAGPITDNETQLYHGGLEYSNADDNGNFDGYVLFMQSQGFWGITSYTRIIDIINYMIINNKLDPFRITANGLSSGGQASWDMVFDYPNYTGASLPMSNVSIGYNSASTVNAVKFTPMWNFQGSLDGSPSPSTAEQVDAAMVNAGGDYRYSEYANVGHNTWDSAFADPDFFPFMLRAYSSNPWPLYGKTGFCTGDIVNVTLGVPPGFDGYQWRKNGVLISGATSNSITVTAFGTYDARVLRGSTWSDWSHTPVVLQITPPTLTPTPAVSGLMSNVLQSGDGKNYVNLQVPGNNYTSYTWKKAGSDSIISTQKIYTATQTGQYIAAVTQQYGCSTTFSPPFSVINAKGFNPPDPASKLTATTLSSTQILLNWENNPHPLYNETYFEIYRSISPNDSYSFIGKVGADTLTFIDSKLSPGVNYFYKIRAVNNNGAALLSNIAGTLTVVDKTPPTAPGNLQIVYATNSSIKIQWDSSTDNVGVENYQVYINGVESYTTSNTYLIINALQQGKVYSFYVKAIDSIGNYSIQSNIASSPAILNGLVYKYYEGYWLSVPDFNTLIPLETGVVPNVTLTPAHRQTQFGFLWQGVLNVPITGSYRIGLTSDDGSRLWLSAYNPSTTPLIDNDHQGNKKSKYATITLQAGSYPISISYFQNKDGKGIQLNWSNQTLFGDSLMHPIDNQYLVGNYTPADTASATPNNLTATVISNSKLQISWADKSNNETGFQIYRSTRSNGGFSILYTTTANITQYIDSGLNPGVTYYYKINSVNNYGTSAYTSVVSATTIALTPPKAPTNTKATAVSSSSIKVTWTDVDSTEINYKVFRSATDTTNFKIAAILPANTTTFTDSGLYGNTYYYYRVITVGPISTSTNKISYKAKTQDNPPVILNKFTTKVIRYGIKTTVVITAADPDADTLSFSVKQLPSFGSLFDSGNGSATLTFNPLQQDQANYSNIKITVKDGNNGQDSDVFTLTVNDNYSPAIDSVPDYVLNEGDVVTIPLSATDQNTGDTLNWTVTGMPNNYSLVAVSNGKINLILRPTYGASGIYKISATVTDGKGGIGIRQFNVTVNDKDPSQAIYLRFKDVDTIGAPWNSITGVTSSNFKDVLNKATSVGLNMQTSWWATGSAGPQTGNNSGIYPDAVMKDYYYFGSAGGPQTVASKITGLDTSRSYYISFYGSSIWSGALNNGTTIYTIGSVSIPLNVQNNTTNTANFNIVKPASDGSISFTMSKGVNTTSGYINAIVIKSIFTDTSKPAAPAFLAAVNVSGKGVQLSWNDVAYNETGYNVYRALNNTGPFTLINGSLPFNSISYLDTAASGSTRYFYMVKASNAQGSSDSSNIVSIATPDRLPVIKPISSITIKNNQQQTISVTTTDDTSDHVTLTVSNLPSFVTFTDNGNGTGLFTVTPSSGITGTFEEITVTATDNSDSSSSTSFNITITDQNVTSVYINFSSGTVESSPWNNFTVWPVANTTLTNLYDDNNSLTSISLKLMNGFQGNFSTGMQPGNNKNVYPDTVIRTGEYEGTTKTDSIQISGLNKSKKYNFVFFNSHDDGQIGNTNFVINGQTVSLNATHNINKTAQINGIVPDVNGQAIIKVSKASGAAYAYINSLVIQIYDSAQVLIPPSDLRVVGVTRTTVNLQWADRSSDETGFEIWRATDSTNSSYTLLKTVAANTTSYIDSNLNSGHTYYYTVRAIKTGLQSVYCNVAAATTYTQVVYVNFTYQSNANVPWNNTDALPQQGLVWNNFFDNTGIPSSVGMEETGVFAGLYGPGMNTGNNSGIFPDKVLADSYGLFAGGIATMKVTGLNLNLKYDLTFFASSQANGDVNSSYTINGKKGVLNASLNIDGTVTVYNITPDENGEIAITIAPNTFSSQFGLIGALLIQEYNSNNNSIPQAPPSIKKQGIASTTKVQQASSADLYNNQISVYPNPFSKDFIIAIQLEKQDNIEVELYDITGKLICSKDFGEIQQGIYNLRLQPAQNTPPGTYFIKIAYRNSKIIKYIKILKQ